MKHARIDYDRIQDPAGLIPEDEPVFLLRGKDMCAPDAIKAWCNAATAFGVDQDMIFRALQWAQEMRDWQKKHGYHVPDMPKQ